LFHLPDRPFRLLLLEAKTTLHEGAEALLHLRRRVLAVNDAIKDGITKACSKHRIRTIKIDDWARQLGREIPDRRSKFSKLEKRAIVEEGYRNGIGLACGAYKISPMTYWRWRRELGL
jgi:hypothetical protein